MSRECGVPCQFSRKNLYVLTFLLGFLTLGIEILGLRVISVIAGSSSLTTGNVIAAVILSLSFGYYLSAQSGLEPRRALVRGLGAAAVLLFISPVSIWCLKKISFDIADLVSLAFAVKLLALSFAGSIIICGLPCLAIGYCSPYVFTLLADRIGDTRLTASRSFIFGGFGSLLGTLLPNLLLIPSLGVNLSFILFGLVLGLYLVMTIRRDTAGKVSAAGLLVLSVLPMMMLDRGLDPVPQGFVAKSETPYQTIYIQNIEARPGHPPITGMVFNRGPGVQSHVDPDGKLTRLTPYDNFMIFLNRFFAPGTTLVPGKVKVLILGSAGCETSNYIHHFYSGLFKDLTIDNLDLDGETHLMAERYFRAAQPRTRFLTCDARFYIRHSKERYDFIIIDLYKEGLTIPSSVISVEFFHELRNSMKEGAVVSVNVNAVSTESELLQVITDGMQRSFRNVYFSRISEENEQGIVNFLVSACDDPIDFRRLLENNPVPEMKEEYSRMVRQSGKCRPNNRAVHDDTASTEILTAKLLLELAFQKELPSTE